MTETKQRRLQEESAARAPRQQQPDAQLGAANAQPKAPPVADPPTPAILTGDEKITLVRPFIRLAEHIITAAGKQFNVIEPTTARIQHGAVIIDEMHLIIPLSRVSFIELRATPRKD